MMRFQTLHQASWDWRAAGNFMFGGTGSGLLILAAAGALTGTPPVATVLIALAFMAAGLSLVWLEIGRPWRALNVFFHPETSWMTREAIVAGVSFALAIAGLVFGPPALLLVAALAAAGFLYCQARILRAAKGIPAWREPALQPLIIATGLVEGCAVLMVLTLLARTAIPAPMAGLLALLVMARGLAWLAYRDGVCKPEATPPATRQALQGIHLLVLGGGTALPLLLLAPAGFAGGAGQVLALFAALAALGSGWWLKFTIVTRAAQVQGFAFGKLRKGHPLGLKAGRAA